MIVEKVKPIESIKKIIEQCQKISCPVVNIVYQKEVTFEEVNVENEIKKFCQSHDGNSIQVMEIWGSSLYHESDIPFRKNNVPDTYTQFRKEVENKAKIRPLKDMPEKLKPLPKDLLVNADDNVVPDLKIIFGEDQQKNKDQRTAFPYEGGETSALDR